LTLHAIPRENRRLARVFSRRPGPPPPRPCPTRWPSATASRPRDRRH